MLNKLKKLFVIPTEKSDDEVKWLPNNNNTDFFATDRSGKKQSSFSFTKGAKRIIFTIDILKLFKKKKS